MTEETLCQVQVVSVQKKLAAAVIVALGISFCAVPALAGAADDLARGKKLLKEMEDAKALKAFEAALAAEGINDKLRGEIYLNRGIAQSNLLNRAAAIESFKSALAADPEVTPPQLTSPKIKVLFDDIKRKAKEEADKAKTKTKTKLEPKPEPTPLPPPEPAEPKPTSINWPAWILLGGAAVAGGVGIAMGALSKSDSDKAADLELTYGQAQEHHDRAKTRATVANILLPVAGAAALTAALLFYLDRSKSEQPSAAVVPLEGGVLVQVNGVRF
jgi:tetratricopeptide (TPR) repeat protein